MELININDPMIRFFAFARERHSIYIKRFVEGKNPPFTNDPTLQRYKFTNVFRELDATTVWFRKHVRDELRTDPHVLLATVLFRWFNRIPIGEAIFSQMQFSGGTTWERRGPLRTKTEAAGFLAELLAYIRPAGPPYVTGAYIIKGTDGMDKLEGVLDAFYQFMTEVREVTFIPNKAVTHWQEVAYFLLSHRGNAGLQDVWNWLKQYSYLGPFTAYEVICDLRYTALLDQAFDINTWANPGPGAMRGLARVHDRFISASEKKPSRLGADGRVGIDQMMEEMRGLLHASRSETNWPSLWPKWEMREVEHTLCEFDKWERARLGQGRPRNIWFPKRAA